VLGSGEGPPAERDWRRCADPVPADELCDVNLGEGSVYTGCWYNISYLYLCLCLVRRFSEKIRVPRAAFLLGEF
jgi:hypothetical protein